MVCGCVAAGAGTGNIATANICRRLRVGACLRKGRSHVRQECILKNIGFMPPHHAGVRGMARPQLPRLLTAARTGHHTTAQSGRPRAALVPAEVVVVVPVGVAAEAVRGADAGHLPQPPVRVAGTRVVAAEPVLLAAGVVGAAPVDAARAAV
jgi:hypothetical protein